MGGPLWFCFHGVFSFCFFLVTDGPLRVRLERQRARLEALYLSEDDL